MRGVGLAFFVAMLIVPDAAQAQERITAYAVDPVTIYDSASKKTGEKEASELPPIPQKGLSFERMPMGLVRVRFPDRTTFVFNRSHVKIELTATAGIENGCEGFKSSTGERKKANIGIGFGGCNDNKK